MGIKNPIVNAGHVILQNKYAYASYQFCVGGTQYRDRLVRDSFITHKPEIVVDMGCGPGNSLNAISPMSDFVGIDLSAEYLQLARAKSVSAKLICSDVTKSVWMGQFEHKPRSLYLAMGLLHHLSDEQTSEMLTNLRDFMPRSCTLFTVDPTITGSSTDVAKWFARNDRGQFIRDPKSLVGLLEKMVLAVSLRFTRSNFAYHWTPSK
jgi:SAM-dependent methyltransferase